MGALFEKVESFSSNLLFLEFATLTQNSGLQSIDCGLDHSSDCRLHSG
jgi:hypothetical protein